MAETEEGWHTANDGVKLYTKTWKAQGTHIANVVFVHGFSDHCNNYQYLFSTMASEGIEVKSWDQRLGRSVKSPADKGLTGPTSRVLADITSVIQTKIPSTVPLFLMGHSMGGQEVLTWAAHGPADVRSHIRGFLTESPFIGLGPETRPSAVTVVAGRLAAKVLPKMHMVQPLKPELICRDPEIGKAYAADPLCHDTGTLEGLAGMLDRAAALDSGKVLPGEDVKSIWNSHGSADGIVTAEATRNYHKLIEVEDKEYKEYPGLFHTLHVELGDDKVIFAKDVIQWIKARLN